MKPKRAVVLAALFFSLVGAFLEQPLMVSAAGSDGGSYWRHNDCGLNGGVGDYGNNNRYYYIDSSCYNMAGLETNIESAWNGWIYTTSRLGVTTPISVERTYIKSDSVFDFYYRNEFDADEGIYAVTYCVVDGIQAGGLYEMYISWDWTNIVFNSASFPTLSTHYVPNKQLAVCAHEIGHAMGLMHVGSQSVLMYPNPTFFLVDQCTVYETYGINDLY